MDLRGSVWGCVPLVYDGMPCHGLHGFRVCTYIIVFIYLGGPGLRCCAGFSPVAASKGRSRVAVLGLLVAERGLWSTGSVVMAHEFSWSPRWCSGKSTGQCRRRGRPGFDPWVGKIPLEEDMATHPRILAWRIPWTEEPGGLQSMGS